MPRDFSFMIEDSSFEEIYYNCKSLCFELPIIVSHVSSEQWESLLEIFVIGVWVSTLFEFESSSELFSEINEFDLSRIYFILFSMLSKPFQT